MTNKNFETTAAKHGLTPERGGSYRPNTEHFALCLPNTIVV